MAFEAAVASDDGDEISPVVVVVTMGIEESEKVTNAPFGFSMWTRFRTGVEPAPVEDGSTGRCRWCCCSSDLISGDDDDGRAAETIKDGGVSFNSASRRVFVVKYSGWGLNSMRSVV